MDHKTSTEETAKTIKSSPVIQALHVKALFVGETIWQEKVSHILCECVASAKYRFRRLGKHFYGTKRL
jgi:hypothetical protein